MRIEATTRRSGKTERAIQWLQDYPGIGPKRVIVVTNKLMANRLQRQWPEFKDQIITWEQVKRDTWLRGQNAIVWIEDLEDILIQIFGPTPIEGFSISLGIDPKDINR